jgi:hypothetical protein
MAPLFSRPDSRQTRLTIEIQRVTEKRSDTKSYKNETLYFNFTSITGTHFGSVCEDWYSQTSI